MTKNIILYFTLLISLFSCSNEQELNNNNDVAIQDSVFTRSLPAILPGTFSYLGYGYNITGIVAHPNSVCNQVVDLSKLDSIYPTAILDETNTAHSQRYDELYAPDAVQFLKRLHYSNTAYQGKALSSKVLLALFPSIVRDSNALDSRFIYGGYNLYVQFRRLRVYTSSDRYIACLTPSFQHDITQMTPADLVKKYGTHVLTDINLGARLSLYYQTKTNNPDREAAARAGLNDGAKKRLKISIDDVFDTSASSSNYSSRLAYVTAGGSPTFGGTIGCINLDRTVSGINIESWKNSLNEANATLIGIGDNGLIPLYDFISDAVLKQQVKAYIETYMQQNEAKLCHF